MRGIVRQDLRFTFRTLVKNLGFAVGLTAVLLLVVALIACLIPALRASRVEPMVALRDQ